MAKCCNDNLSKIFCNAYNKYYNTLYTNGEISKKETENLLVISYIRKLFINPRYINYRPILIKALRCIADRSCLLDSSQLYGRLDIKTISDKFVTVLMRDIYSIKETDPTVPLYVKDIKQSDITNWNSKLSLETDPIFSASPAATITDEDINNWNNPSASGALIVTVTLDGTYSADKTFTEIFTAWNSGLDIIVYYSDAVYQTSWIDDGGAWFFRTDKTNAGPYVDYFAVDGTDDSWTKNTYNLLTRLTFDNNPTQGSNNPVKSSGIYNMCPIIEDGRSLATDVNITGTAPFDTLAGGQRIVLHSKYANTASPTLQLTLSGGTTTSAYPLYQNYNNGVNALTPHAMPAGSYGEFVFDSTNSRWVLIGKDFNTTYSNTSQADINNSAQGSRLIEPKLLRDNFYLKSEVNNICPIIEDTRSSNASNITGVAPFSTLVDKQKVIIHLAYATGNYTTLQLTLNDGVTTTNAIPIYARTYETGVGQILDGHYRGGTYMELIYNSSQNRWYCLNLDRDTTTWAMYQTEINNASSTDPRAVPSAKLIHDNAYIVELSYSSGSLKANKFYDFGTVSSALTIPSLDATNDLVSNAINFYALRFIAGADNLNITFPTGVIVDDTPTINTGDYVEIMINLYVENNTNHFYASIKVWQAQ